MKFTNSKSILAMAILLGLTACGSDNGEQETIVPLPSKNIQVDLGNATVLAKSEPVTINTVSGAVETHYVESFKGIPFAHSVRFQHSVQREFEGEYDATKFGDACPQLSAIAPTISEDCLSLNVWRPEAMDNHELADLPVYVFVHGGDFETGTSSNPVTIPDVVVAQSIADAQSGERSKPFIAVTFNYRLGIFGSLWVDGENNPQGGNFGIGDQKRALQWVSENIALFGGDSNNVTVFGQGAGAISVGILQDNNYESDILSEDQAAGQYFQRAIMQSNPYGLALKTNKTAKQIRSNAEQYASQLFPENGNVDILTTLSTDELLQVQEKMSSLGGTLTDVVVPRLASIAAEENAALKTALTLVGIPLSGNGKYESMMFAPHMESFKKGLINPTEVPGYHVNLQPGQIEFEVPTVMGFNSEDAQKYTALLDLLFLYNLTTVDENGERVPLIGKDIPLDTRITLDAIKDLINELIGSNVDEESVFATDEDGILLRQNMYNVMTTLLYGTKDDASKTLLAFEDFKPNDDSRLIGPICVGPDCPETDDKGIIGNIKKFNKLNNEAIIQCAGVEVAQKQSVPVAMYHFDYDGRLYAHTKDESIADLLGTALCSINGSCNGSELPYVFNKAYDNNGQAMKVRPNDKELMNQMSRMWFTDEFFEQNPTNGQGMLMIEGGTKDESSTIEYRNDWDQAMNAGIDERTTDGICGALIDDTIILPE
ncbi:carboxylesterase family protein [Vibrio parahaemolyticus]|uniref:carboxylesterase family protein n=1 Tax=Vibrio mediterranei TaxID=689 RepID=UPI0040698229